MFNWHELGKDMVWFEGPEYPILTVRLNELGRRRAREVAQIHCGSPLLEGRRGLGLGLGLGWEGWPPLSGGKPKERETRTQALTP